MNDTLFPFGILIFAVGLFLMFHQYKVWREVEVSEKDGRELRFQFNLFRRRTTVGSLVAIVGALLASLSYRSKDPRTFSLLMLAMLCVLFALLVFAALDALSIWMHRRHGKQADEARKAMVQEYLRQREQAKDKAEKNDESS